jgi:hypothetical protein
MTTSALYDLYCRCYVEYDRSSGASWLPGQAPFQPVQAVIVEFAEEDARNGRPCRTLAEFERSVAAGMEALGPLGLAA